MPVPFFKLMRADNVVGAQAATPHLGIAPTPVEAVVPRDLRG